MKLSKILGLVGAVLIILTGVLTALKITPGIRLVGLEVWLGAWRVLAGTGILIFALLMDKTKLAKYAVLLIGCFEVFVFIFEGDYSILFVSPFVAIAAGILALKGK